jgi:L-lactate dehydrogenase complex protein LldG
MADRLTARDEIFSHLRRIVDAGGVVFRGDAPEASALATRMAVTSAKGNSHTLADQFAAKLESVLGSSERVAPGEAVEDVVARRIAAWASQLEHPAGRDTAVDVLSWAADELPVPGLQEHLAELGIRLFIPSEMHDSAERARAANTMIGLTGVTAAFASTGTVALAPGPGRSRVASLLPLYHLVLVPMSRIHTTVEEWLDAQREAGRLDDLFRQCGQMAFVTGPSKSADIELILALGVHGPQVVHAVVFDDTQAV